MDSATRITTRPKLECAAWLALGLILATAPVWQAYLFDAVNGPMLQSSKVQTGGRRYFSDLEGGLAMLEFLGASASFGFAIGALAGAKRGWGIIGLIVGPMLFVAYRLGTM